MNINYDQILETAHKRLSKLKALELRLADLRLHATNLRDALEYFGDLYEELYDIDAEGRALLGSIPERVGAVRSAINSPQIILTEMPNNKAHLMTLVACVDQEVD